MTSHRSVHPFPARMAPELVDRKIDSLDSGLVVLDPMMGSGSFVVAAARAGMKAIGIDSDPLAVVIARASAGLGDGEAILSLAQEVAALAKNEPVEDLISDSETLNFVRYWFDENTAQRLSSLARIISGIGDDDVRATLWCAFSRLIITKDVGASRARDVSHSRPHVVREGASFDPIARFERSAAEVVARSARFPSGAIPPSILRGDARQIPLATGSVDAIMTSPPYLNAIDYLRGHRLSLVWMGYSISQLRTLRGDNIGSERGDSASERIADVVGSITDPSLLPRRKLHILNRYIGDLERFMCEVSRVLVAGGIATFVIANSTHQAVTVNVDRALEILAECSGMTMSERTTRALPASHRYLPPPKGERSVLRQRMAEEVVLTVRNPSVVRTQVSA